MFNNLYCIKFHIWENKAPHSLSRCLFFFLPANHVSPPAKVVDLGHN